MAPEPEFGASILAVLPLRSRLRSTAPWPICTPSLQFLRTSLVWCGFGLLALVIGLLPKELCSDRAGTLSFAFAWTSTSTFLRSLRWSGLAFLHCAWTSTPTFLRSLRWSGFSTFCFCAWTSTSRFLRSLR